MILVEDVAKLSRLELLQGVLNHRSDSFALLGLGIGRYNHKDANCYLYLIARGLHQLPKVMHLLQLEKGQGGLAFEE